MNISILQIINLTVFDDLWQNYLAMGTPEKLIIGIVVFALFATILYFIYRILDGFSAIFKGIFWILKSIIFLIIMLLFSIFWVIFLIPFGFFKYKGLAEIGELYSLNVQKLKIFFYPKSQDDLILTKEEIAKKVTENDKKRRKKASQKMKKETKTPKKDKVGGKGAASFHCSNCGAEMPSTMVTHLKSGNEAFCEGCGQKFKMEGGVPYPLDN
ncbi:MAG: hypothetical protein ACTSYI_16110 [Promethearchaeota archaeon]